MSSQQTDGQTPPFDSTATDGSGATEARAPLVINAQYVKDLSFEVPGAPTIFAQMQQKAPDINIKVDVQARPLEGNIYEVLLQINADCKIADATAFLMELVYGGVFTLSVPESDVRPFLLIECPRLLFPFARQILASTTLNGGFLPLMLGPVDFAALYQKQQDPDNRSPIVLA